MTSGPDESALLALRTHASWPIRLSPDDPTDIDHVTVVALQLLPAPDDPPDRQLPPRGAFVQVLPGAVSAFCIEHGLDFDERALLEHLLDTADRDSGVVEGCTLSGLARHLGFGPSGRRTLAARLGRLGVVRAIDWEPTWGCDSGRVEVLVYHRLVRSGRGDRRAGYVQVLPGALGAAWVRHDLSASARALLRRLVVDVDHRTHALTGSLRQLTARYGLSRQRLTNALDELVGAGLLRRLPNWLELLAYAELVRLAAPVELVRPRSDRAAVAPESRAGRVENARPSSLLDERQQDLEPETAPIPRAAHTSSTQGQGGGCTINEPDTNLAALALALPETCHHELLVDPAQASGRQALRRRLERLVAEVGQSEAVATMTSDWPEQVASPMALANNRAERRLAELAGSSATAASVTHLAAQQSARRRVDALRGAANLGRAWAGAGVAAEEVAAQFAGDEEAREAALTAFHDGNRGEVGPACHGPDRAPGRRDGPSGAPQRLGFSLTAVAGAPGATDTPGWHPAEMSEGERG